MLRSALADEDVGVPRLSICFPSFVNRATEFRVDLRPSRRDAFENAVLVELIELHFGAVNITDVAAAGLGAARAGR